MASLDVLYLILGVCVVVITVTIVWLASETRQLLRSLRRSAQDTEVVTKEIKEKVLLVGEALDRAGTAATTVIGLIEDAIEQIKEKRDQIVGSVSLLAGAGKYVKQRREEVRKEKEEEKPARNASQSDAGGEKKEVPKVGARPVKSAGDSEKQFSQVKEKPKEPPKEPKKKEPDKKEAMLASRQVKDEEIKTPEPLDGRKDMGSFVLGQNKTDAPQPVANPEPEPEAETKNKPEELGKK